MKVIGRAHRIVQDDGLVRKDTLIDADFVDGPPEIRIVRDQRLSYHVNIIANAGEGRNRHAVQRRDVGSAVVIAQGGVNRVHDDCHMDAVRAVKAHVIVGKVTDAAGIQVEILIAVGAAGSVGAVVNPRSLSAAAGGAFASLW